MSKLLSLFDWTSKLLLILFLYLNEIGDFDTLGGRLLLPTLAGRSFGRQLFKTRFARGTHIGPRVGGRLFEFLIQFLMQIQLSGHQFDLISKVFVEFGQILVFFAQLFETRPELVDFSALLAQTTFQIITRVVVHVDVRTIKSIDFEIAEPTARVCDAACDTNAATITNDS